MKHYSQVVRNVNWLPPIPSHWEVRPLWSVYRRTKKYGDGTEELLSVYRDYGVIPKNSRDDNHNKPSDDLSKYQLVHQNDLVINKMKAWQGSVAISNFTGIVSPAYFVFQPVTQVHPAYMHHLMRSRDYFEEYARLSKGIRLGQWDLDPDMHRNMEVLYPPLEEQRAIADFLDRETAEIDAFIADQERLIELLTERRTATITHAVTKGLDPSVPMRDSGIPWLGEIPAHWKASALTHVAAVKLGKMIPREGEGQGEGYSPYLRAASVQPHGLDLEITKKMKATQVESAQLSLKKGDVVVVEGGAGYGRSAVLHDDLPGYIFQNSINRVRPGRELSSRFLDLLLKSMLWTGQMELLTNKATIPHLTAEKLLSVPVPLPPVTEQRRIETLIDTFELDIREAISDAKRAIDLSRERRAALISAAVTGQIDVRTHA